MFRQKLVVANFFHVVASKAKLSISNPQVDISLAKRLNLFSFKFIWQVLWAVVVNLPLLESRPALSEAIEHTGTIISDTVWENFNSSRHLLKCPVLHDKLPYWPLNQQSISMAYQVIESVWIQTFQNLHDIINIATVSSEVENVGHT